MRRDSDDAGQVGETHRPSPPTKLTVSVSVPLSGSPGLPRDSDKIDDPGNEAP